MIESCKFLEVTDDGGAINLLIGLRYTGIVTDPRSLYRNIPHFTRRIVCETNVGNTQQKTETTTDHYISQGNAS